MILPYQNLLNQVSKKNFHRFDSTINVCEFDTKINQKSHRKFGQQFKILRITLQHWQNRKNTHDILPALVFLGKVRRVKLFYTVW